MMLPCGRSLTPAGAMRSRGIRPSITGTPHVLVGEEGRSIRCLVHHRGREALCPGEPARAKLAVRRLLSHRLVEGGLERVRLLHDLDLIQCRISVVSVESG